MALSLHLDELLEAIDFAVEEVDEAEDNLTIERKHGRPTEEAEEELETAKEAMYRALDAVHIDQLAPETFGGSTVDPVTRGYLRTMQDAVVEFLDLPSRERRMELLDLLDETVSALDLHLPEEMPSEAFFRPLDDGGWGRSSGCVNEDEIPSLHLDGEAKEAGQGHDDQGEHRCQTGRAGLAQCQNWRLCNSPTASLVEEVPITPNWPFRNAPSTLPATATARDAFGNTSTFSDESKTFSLEFLEEMLARSMPGRAETIFHGDDEEVAVRRWRRWSWG